ncbi:MAG: hypothetical protein CVU47_07230 [Chloroflexi bacterium HGW-Chloroflexi-9]|nr:MAG: hypothetical protein CVU47_07230 [Chloroflexi bacterium HGW-Chloroflexi-9]
MALTLLGGIGIFLLGMVLLTDGLKAAAGGALRGVLGRLTGGPLKAVASGAAITALVQSSSATTLATIGFVSAGLLTFQQSVGVILGANIGTTSTGWIVSVLGLKANIATVALPLVAVGALMRLLGRERTASIGLALAGFGLIFVGIEFMQDGMAGLADDIDLGAVSADGVGGRLVLAGIGLLMTVLMQSSSAAVATTLTAVFTGAIGLEAAAALVVGQNVGTTVTAAVAAIGASTPAQRTALAHIGFNVLTATAAFLLLPLVPALADATGLQDDPAIAVAAFHTGFNFLGVALLLPVAAPYARVIERLIPERDGALTRHLDPSVASISPVALEAARRTLLNVATVEYRAIIAILGRDGGSHPNGRALADARPALAEARRFLALVRTSPDSTAEYHRHVDLLHAIDHLDRMLDALAESHHATVARTPGPLHEASMRLAGGIHAALDWVAAPDGSAPLDDLGAMSAALAADRRHHRRELLARAAGFLSPDDAMRQVDAMMWLDRLGYHAWRAAVHLAGTEADAAADVAAYDEREARPAG